MLAATLTNSEDAVIKDISTPPPTWALLLETHPCWQWRLWMALRKQSNKCKIQQTLTTKHPKWLAAFAKYNKMQQLNNNYEQDYVTLLLRSKHDCCWTSFIKSFGFYNNNNNNIHYYISLTCH